MFVQAIVGTRCESEHFYLGEGLEEEEGRELVLRILTENKISLGKHCGNPETKHLDLVPQSCNPTTPEAMADAPELKASLG